MRLAASSTVPALVCAGFLAASCTDDGAGNADAEQRSTTAESPSPSSDRGAERAAEEAERCDSLLSRVRLRFQITATSAADGTSVGLRTTLVNRSESELVGSTAGLLKVGPDPRTQRISWGGSSADQLYQEPRSTTRREVWHDRRPPGWHPMGDRVTDFDFYTYVYAPGPGTVTCDVPATVTAPPGLVEGHPSGRWSQESNP